MRRGRARGDNRIPPPAEARRHRGAPPPFEIEHYAHGGRGPPAEADRADVRVAGLHTQRQLRKLGLTGSTPSMSRRAGPGSCEHADQMAAAARSISTMMRCNPGRATAGATATRAPAAAYASTGRVNGDAGNNTQGTERRQVTGGVNGGRRSTRLRSRRGIVHPAAAWTSVKAQRSRPAPIGGRVSKHHVEIGSRQQSGDALRPFDKAALSCGKQSARPVVSHSLGSTNR